MILAFISIINLLSVYLHSTILISEVMIVLIRDQKLIKYVTRKKCKVYSKTSIIVKLIIKS